MPIISGEEAYTYIPEEGDEDSGEGDSVASLFVERWEDGHDHDKDTCHGAEGVDQRHALGHQRQGIQIVGKEPLDGYGRREGEAVGGGYS